MASKLYSRAILAASVTAGLLTISSAHAWYGGPWHRPYGAGAVTYERQSIMRRHGYAMDDLSRMFNGRSAFDRDEAVRLARELSEGFSGDLIRNTPPGAVVAGSRTAPWTWNNFGTFQGYNEAARQSANRLVEALEQQPTAEEIRQDGAWMPAGRRVMGPLGFSRHGAIPLEAVREYSRLNATCYSCHMLFRGGRW